MSEEYMELVRRAEAAFNASGPWAPEEFVTHDVEWATTGSFPGIDRIYRGPDGMDKWRQDLRSVWQNFEVSAGEVLVEADDLLVIEERIRGRGLESGVDVEMRLFSAYHFRDGKVAKRVAYTDKREALEGRGDA